MYKSDKSILALVPFLIKKLSVYRTCAYRIVAVAYTKKGNMLGIEMNGHRMLPPVRRGTGKHAEAALIKRFGKRIDKIYILRTGNSGDILPIHACDACASMAAKIGATIIPIHELLDLC